MVQNKNKNAFGWIIKVFNGNIKIVVSRQLDNTSVIITGNMTLKDGITLKVLELWLTHY